MQNVLVLGGGVGGTLVANLISRKIKKQIDAGTARVTVVDERGEHVYQPGFMYIAMGNEDPRSLRKPERRLLDDRVELVIGEVTGIDEESQAVSLADGSTLDYDYLVLATGSRILPETIEHFEQEAHHFYSEEAALRLRKALDTFTGGKVVVGIASMPYKCPPAPLEVALLI
ncbi:MAG: FAD-dependent oxidoreductase, partial [Chloroflexota bacterium]